MIYKVTPRKNIVVNTKELHSIVNAAHPTNLIRLLDTTAKQQPVIGLLNTYHGFSTVAGACIGLKADGTGNFVLMPASADDVAIFASCKPTTHQNGQFYKISPIANRTVIIAKPLEQADRYELVHCFYYSVS